MLGAMNESPRTPPQPDLDATPGLDLDLLLLTMLLGVSIMLGVLLAAGGPWSGYYTVHLWLPMWLIACIVFGGARLVDRPAWLRLGVRMARGQFVEYGGGFYGAVALIAFAWLEWGRGLEFYQALVGAESERMFWRSLLGFFIDSIMNGISAMVWPAFHAKAFEMRNFWPALGISAGVYAVAQALMGWLPARPRA